MTLADYARRVNGTVVGDPATELGGIASIDEAGPGSLTFATDERYVRLALASRAGAVLVDAALAEVAAAGRAKPLVVVPSARAALVVLLTDLAPAAPDAGVHPSAVVDPSALVDPSASVGPGAIVGARAVVGARVRIGAGATVGADARIGDDAILHPRALLLERCVVGARSILHPGAVVGSDGFGFVFVDGHFRRIPQVGNVVLGDDVEIGANTCVDRAQIGSTTIGDGTKIDNLVQIGHNVRIGHDAAFAAMTGIAGSAIIGDYTVVGGKAAFNGHITVGSRVRVAGNTMVWNDVADGAQISGQPAQDHRAELRWQVRLRKIDKLESRVNALEQK